MFYSFLSAPVKHEAVKGNFKIKRKNVSSSILNNSLQIHIFYNIVLSLGLEWRTNITVRFCLTIRWEVFRFLNFSSSLVKNEAVSDCKMILWEGKGGRSRETVNAKMG